MSEYGRRNRAINSKLEICLWKAESSTNLFIRINES
jgi:hypothetical protein